MRELIEVPEEQRAGVLLRATAEDAELAQQVYRALQFQERVLAAFDDLAKQVPPESHAAHVPEPTGRGG